MYIFYDYLFSNLTHLFLTVVGFHCCAGFALVVVSGRLLCSCGAGLLLAELDL